MKRIAAIALLLTMLLCACAGTADTTDEPSVPVETPAPTQEATSEPVPEETSEAEPEATPEQPPETEPETVPEATPEPTPVPPASPAVDESVLLSFDGMYFEPRPALDSSSLDRLAEKMISLRDSYFPDSKVYYTIVPDKSWYFRDRTDKYFDHAAICDSLSTKLSDFTAIDISDALSGSDYYVTDPHWRQEKLGPVVKTLAGAMGFTYNESSFTSTSAGTFVGAYGRKAKGFAPEELFCLTSSLTDSAVVDNFQQTEFRKIYDSAKFASNGYDIYLSGATPLTVIKNPNAAEKRELVIFRDSFGSSIAPLMLESYSKITLVDLRYMVSFLLPEHVDFTDAEVLFLYCDELVNSSFLLK